MTAPDTTYTAASWIRLRTAATLALHRRLESAKAGAPVVVTSRCCHALPGMRDAIVAGDPDRWLKAERDALASVAAWARGKGFAAEIRSHDSPGHATVESRRGGASCCAYESVIIRRQAA